MSCEDLAHTSTHNNNLVRFFKGRHGLKHCWSLSTVASRVPIRTQISINNGAGLSPTTTALISSSASVIGEPIVIVPVNCLSASCTTSSFSDRYNLSLHRIPYTRSRWANLKFSALAHHALQRKSSKNSSKSLKFIGSSQKFLNRYFFVSYQYKGDASDI